MATLQPTGGRMAQVGCGVAESSKFSATVHNRCHLKAVISQYKDKLFDQLHPSHEWTQPMTMSVPTSDDQWWHTTLVRRMQKASDVSFEARSSPCIRSCSVAALGRTSTRSVAESATDNKARRQRPRRVRSGRAPVVGTYGYSISTNVGATDADGRRRRQPGRPATGRALCATNARDCSRSDWWSR